MFCYVTFCVFLLTSFFLSPCVDVCVYEWVSVCAKVCTVALLPVFQPCCLIIRVTFVQSCGAIWMRPTHMWEKPAWVWIWLTSNSLSAHTHTHKCMHGRTQTPNTDGKNRAEADMWHLTSSEVTQRLIQILQQTFYKSTVRQRQRPAGNFCLQF